MRALNRVTLQSCAAVLCAAALAGAAIDRADPLYGNPVARFDPLKFESVGSIAKQQTVCATWHTNKIKTPHTISGNSRKSCP